LPPLRDFAGRTNKKPHRDGLLTFAGPGGDVKVAPTAVINIAGGPGGLTACVRSSDAAQVNIEPQGKVLDLPWLWCCGYHLTPRTNKRVAG
jgi:hypothetical protein